jgi:hypothetical protein
MTFDSEQVNFWVYENNAPLVTVRLKRKIPGGTFAPYLLAGGPTFKYVAKNDPDDTDANAVISYTGSEFVIVADGSAPGAEYSELTIQFAATDLDTPGEFYHRLDVTKSGKVLTVLKGFLIVENV